MRWLNPAARRGPRSISSGSPGSSSGVGSGPSVAVVGINLGMLADPGDLMAAAMLADPGAARVVPAFQAPPPGVGAGLGFFSGRWPARRGRGPAAPSFTKIHYPAISPSSSGGSPCQAGCGDRRGRRRPRTIGRRRRPGPPTRRPTSSGTGRPASTHGRAGSRPTPMVRTARMSGPWPARREAPTARFSRRPRPASRSRPCSASGCPPRPAAGSRALVAGLAPGRRARGPRPPRGRSDDGDLMDLVHPGPLGARGGDAPRGPIARRPGRGRARRPRADAVTSPGARGLPGRVPSARRRRGGCPAGSSTRSGRRRRRASRA